MISAKIYNLEGKMVGEQSLDEKFFGVKVNPSLIKQAVEAHMANTRQVLAHAKGRAEVRGGGRKPWKQKGTGRARHGSTRSPLWVGGGVTFGPTKERNFDKDINKKAKKRALQMVLADKAANQRLVLMEELNLSEAKTKKMAQLLAKLPVAGKTTSIVMDKNNENILRASKNLPKVSLLAPLNFNVVDLLKNEYILMSVKAVDKVVKHYSF